MYHILGLILLLSIYLFSGIHKFNDFYNISNDLKTKFQDKFPLDLPIEFYYFTCITSNVTNLIRRISILADRKHVMDGFKAGD